MTPDSSKPERRELILSAAEQLFQHYGFAKTTVSDIARAADVGVGTVYLEFASKEAIAAELSVRRYRSVLEAMRQAAGGTGSYAERLTAVFQAGLDRLSRYTGEGPHGKELIVGACTATDRAHADFRAQEEALLTEFLSAAAAAGEFDVPEPRVTARVLLRYYRSYAGCHTDPERTRAELETAHALVLFGLIKRTSG